MKVMNMNVKEEGFLGGFLVLGFVIFIVSFLSGMLAIAFVPVNQDFGILAAVVLIFGFMAGVLTIALLLIIVKLRQLAREPV